MLTIFVTIVHVIVSVFLIMVVLLQTGKRADLAGAFGGGGSQTAFGARGAATILSKLTTAAAVGFMVTSISLAILGTQYANQSGDSILPEDQPPAQTQQAPAPQLPATPAPDPAPAGGTDVGEAGDESVPAGSEPIEGSNQPE